MNRKVNSYLIKISVYYFLLYSLACKGEILYFDSHACRKKLKKGVLLYVHVNMSFSLLLALLVFAFGLETATFNSVRLFCRKL